MEEVPLYGNLPYLQTGRKLAEGRGTEATHILVGWDEGLQKEEQEVTRLLLFPISGRLSQEPGPDQQDPTPRGPGTVSQLWLRKRGGKEVGVFPRVQ